MVCENADRRAVSSPALPFLSVASDNGPSSIASKCHGEAKQGGPQTVLSGVHKGGFFGIAIVASLAVACSSGDDEADVPASAGTAVTASTTAVAEDESAGESEEAYTLAQQFDLSISVTSSKFNDIRRIPRKYGCTEEDIPPPPNVEWHPGWDGEHCAGGGQQSTPRGPLGTPGIVGYSAGCRRTSRGSTKLP